MSELVEINVGEIKVWVTEAVANKYRLTYHNNLCENNVDPPEKVEIIEGSGLQLTWTKRGAKVEFRFKPSGDSEIWLEEHTALWGGELIPTNIPKFIMDVITIYP